MLRLDRIVLPLGALGFLPRLAQIQGEGPLRHGGFLRGRRRHRERGLDGRRPKHSEDLARDGLVDPEPPKVMQRPVP
jgi:hypothetical protein